MESDQAGLGAAACALQLIHPSQGAVLHHYNKAAYILHVRAICVGLWRRTIREKLPLNNTCAEVEVKCITPPLVNVCVCWLVASSTIYLPALFKMNPSSGRIVRIDRRVGASSFVCVLYAGVSMRAFVRMFGFRDRTYKRAIQRYTERKRRTPAHRPHRDRQAERERELAQRKCGWTRNTGIASKANQEESREKESDIARWS